MNKFININFALALLFAMPTLACVIFRWELGFVIFGGSTILFGMLEIGGIALAILLDK